MASFAALRLDRRAWGQLAHVYRGQGGRIALCTLGSALQSALVLPSLLLMRLAFDRAIPQRDIWLLVGIGAALVGLRLLGSLAALAVRARIVRVVRGATRRLRRDILHDLYARAHAATVVADTSRLHSQVVFETERIDNMADAVLSGALPALVTALVLAVLLLWIDPWLVAIAALFLPLVWFAGRATGGRLQARVRDFQRAFEDFGHGIRFMLDHLTLTRARAAEDWEMARQAATIDRLGAAAVRMADVSARHSHLQTNIVGLPGVVLLVAGGIAVANGAMTLGSFLIFYVAAGQLNSNLDRLGNVLPAVLAGNESLMTLRQLREQGPAEPYRGERVIDWHGEISLRDVTFGYDATVVLRNVSLVLRPGMQTAIIGPNGAGKTTLINLILGFYRPQAGALCADGKPYDQLDLRALRRRIGLVPQHPTLFAGTVFENICYGRPDATHADAMEAVRRAGAERLLARLPQGLESRVGENAAMLSGGERQLLALARALLGHPLLLILDEPTNHLDQATIGRVLAALAADPSKPAVLLISHDPVVVAHFRDVWRLEDERLLAERAPRSAMGAM